MNDIVRYSCLMSCITDALYWQHLPGRHDSSLHNIETYEFPKRAHIGIAHTAINIRLPVFLPHLNRIHKQ